MLDLVFMGSAADRSGGDVALPICLGETHYTSNGIPGTGTVIKPKAKGAILGAFTNSETGALADLRMRTQDDPNYIHLNVTHLQTDPLRTQVINLFNYPIDVGQLIEAEGTSAGSQMDLLGLFISKGKDSMISAIPPADIPEGCTVVRGVATFTHVADSVAEGQVVLDDYVLNEKKTYSILGFSCHSASGLGSRLRFITGPNINDRPGVPTADTSTGLEYKMWFGDFGTFDGLNPPYIQTVSIAADSETVVYFLIKEN